jgi:hypothetical protein
MARNRGGDAFAADQAGAKELEGVAAVGVGTRGADGGAAVAAGFVDVAVGQLGGGEAGESLAGGGTGTGTGTGTLSAPT